MERAGVRAMVVYATNAKISVANILTPGGLIFFVIIWGI